MFIWAKHKSLMVEVGDKNKHIAHGLFLPNYVQSYIK